MTKEQASAELRQKVSDYPFLPDRRGKRPDWTWRKRKKRMSRTSDIAYRCDFIDGSCKQERENIANDQIQSQIATQENRKNKPYITHSEMACCAGCAHAVGYFDAVEDTDVPLLISLYNPKTGYWRSGKGCILPRDIRSNICLTHNCGEGPNVLYQMQQLVQIGSVPSTPLRSLPPDWLKSER